MLLAESLPQIKPLFIGSLKVDPPILQAPMAGYTNFAFRQIVREYALAQFTFILAISLPLDIVERARHDANRAA